MQSRSLLYGIIGFILGGLLVSVAATTFAKPATDMSKMTASLSKKTGDTYDQLFLADMIEHHQAAVDMAKLSATNAKHSEIRSMSDDIISAQEKEIQKMKQWQKEWGYDANMSDVNQD